MKSLEEFKVDRSELSSAVVDLEPDAKCENLIPLGDSTDDHVAVSTVIRSVDPRRLTKRQTRGEDVAVSLSHKKSKKLVRALNCVATQDEVLQNSVASKQASGAFPSWCVNVAETNVRETDGFDNVVREDHRPLFRQANASVEQRIKTRFHVILEHLSSSEICQPEMSGLPALVVKEVLHCVSDHWLCCGLP